MPDRKSLEHSDAVMRLEAEVAKGAVAEEHTSSTAEDKRTPVPKKKKRTSRHAVFRQFLKAVSLGETSEYADAAPDQQSNYPKPNQQESQESSVNNLKEKNQ